MRNNFLDITACGNDTFESVWHQPNFKQTLFGGQVVAQALLAACKTVEERPPHSLHAYFLRAGDAQNPITYKVRRLRDGQSVSSRSVDAIQNGKVLCSVMCSFHQPEAGFEHQFSHPGPSTPAQELKKQGDQLLQKVSEFTGMAPIDYAAYDDSLFSLRASDNHGTRFWLKSTATLSEPPAHFGALTFCSDIGLLATALLTHKSSVFARDVIPASMDHAVWFHRQPDFNQWHQYVTDSPWAGSARVLCSGQLFNEAGDLVASVMQEGLIRPI